MAHQTPHGTERHASASHHEAQKPSVGVYDRPTGLARFPMSTILIFVVLLLALVLAAFYLL